jgi:uncharacterized protein (TIGR00369 family)
MTGIDRRQLDSIIETSFFRSILKGEVTQFGEGRCELRVAVAQTHRQFLGAVHGGIIGALADDSCAWACASEAGELVTATYTLNLLATAMGSELIARGRLIKAGRRLCVGIAEVFSVKSTKKSLVAVFQGTMSVINDRRAVPKRLVSTPGHSQDTPR